MLGRLRRVVGDPSVEIALLDSHEPTPLSRAAGPAWDRVAAAVGVACPEGLPIPSAVLQASDARRFTDHGADERVSIPALHAVIAFHRNPISGR